MTPIRTTLMAIIAALYMAGATTRASAAPSILVDVDSGRVLEHFQATRPWYPASLTKLLTIYVALSAVRDGQVTMDTPFVVSARAASMPPSKMGFKPGTEVTLDNALKMLMVKSANDLAITIAEGVSGSVEDFAARMNRTAAKLGLKDSHFANPNGLPNPDHYSSARDLAIVALALFHDFPQDDWLYDIGAFKLGKLIVPTYNNLLGRYPGVDGMKTGYTCASGFNIVVSAKRGGRHLVAVVMGAPNIKERTETATALLDAGFEGVFPNNGPLLSQLPRSDIKRPADIHDETCVRRRKIIAENQFLPPQLRFAHFTPAPGGLPPMAAEVRLAGRPHFKPLPVFVGPKPGWTGPIAEPKDLATPITAYAPQKGRAGPLSPDPKAAPLRVSKAKAKTSIRRKHEKAARRPAHRIVRRHTTRRMAAKYAHERKRPTRMRRRSIHSRRAAAYKPLNLSRFPEKRVARRRVARSTHATKALRYKKRPTAHE